MTIKPTFKQYLIEAKYVDTSDRWFNQFLRGPGRHLREDLIKSFRQPLEKLLHEMLVDIGGLYDMNVAYAENYNAEEADPDDPQDKLVMDWEVANDMYKSMTVYEESAVYQALHRKLGVGTMDVIVELMKLFVEEYGERYYNENK